MAGGLNHMTADGYVWLSVQFYPDGGQFDFAHPAARAIFPTGRACRWGDDVKKLTRLKTTTAPIYPCD